MQDYAVPPGLFALPSTFLADTGTPLMWATGFHLLIGNIFIGLGEAALLSWRFAVPRSKSALTMIAANYVSAWLGEFLIGVSAHRFSSDLDHHWRHFWICVFASYCITLAVEWPFVASCLPMTKGWFKRSIQASFLVQSASYIVLFGWYGLASCVLPFSGASIVEASKLSLPDSVLVYYISSRDGNVYASALNRGEERLVYELHSTDPNDLLCFQPSAT